ncbi:MAG: hypothetical protein E6J90_09620 [Deltaproteobacteria bacterium]|nr:MAG: hypothetical protein E6J90_09620 [Deltaproteobacteria bacterium]
MALKLAQSDENVRPDWWRWSVWLEGGGDELDRVSDVTYLLHPTFPEPVRVVSDRSSAFRLDSAGWGEFMIRADVRMGDGTVRTIHHELELHVAEPPGPASDVPQVFLSHSAIDGRLAAHVSRELESHGGRDVAELAGGGHDAQGAAAEPCVRRAAVRHTLEGRGR